MKYYTEDHAWVEIHGDVATIGVSEFAIEKWGEITYLELPEEDEDIIIGDELGMLETDNGSNQYFTPISGTVSQINEALLDDLEPLNESPEDKGWLCKISNFDESELDDMMTFPAYQRYLKRCQ